MTKLKLGPLPKAGMTRVTISLPDPLKEELDLYAAEHGRLYEPVEVAALIPHMLEAFLRSDRGWRSRRAKIANEAKPAPSGQANREAKLHLSRSDQ